MSGNANTIPVLNSYAFIQIYDATNNQKIVLSNKYALGSSTATTFIDGTFEYRIRIDNGCTYDNVILHPQLELGSVATSYEPYKGSITEHIYLDEPLRKVGDYADYIDFKNKKVVRNVVQGVLNGSESLSTSGTRYYYYNTKLNIKCLGTTVAGIKSNALPSVAWNWIRNSGTGIATYSDNRIDIRADGVWTSVDKAKEYLKSNPIYYIAPCLVPTEEDISLPSLKALQGTNIISVDTSVIPSNMECEYYSTTKQEEE